MFRRPLGRTFPILYSTALCFLILVIPLAWGQLAPTQIIEKERKTTNVYNYVGLLAQSETIDVKSGKILITRVGIGQNVGKEEFAERIRNHVLSEDVINVYTPSSDYHPTRVVSIRYITFYKFDGQGYLKSSLTWENIGTLLEPKRGKEIFSETIVERTTDYKSILDHLDLRTGQRSRIVTKNGVEGRIGGCILSETLGNEVSQYKYDPTHYAGLIPKTIEVIRKDTGELLRKIIVANGAYVPEKEVTIVQDIGRNGIAHTRTWDRPWRLIYLSTTH